jgi:cell division septation protein DedD
MLMDGMKGFGEKLGEWFHIFSDPKRSHLRRPFYWGLGILVVVLLFLGVNALNSQREEAMRERYKLRSESATVEVPAMVAEKVALVSTPAVEREVVITPAPVRPKKLPSTEGGEASSATQAGGAFVIQVVTYPTKQDADQVVGTLAREGFRAFVKEDIRPTGRVFYLVLIGGFRSEAEAQAQLLKFRAKEIARPFQDAFIKTSRA